MILRAFICIHERYKRFVSSSVRMALHQQFYDLYSNEAYRTLANIHIVFVARLFYRWLAGSEILKDVFDKNPIVYITKRDFTDFYEPIFFQVLNKSQSSFRNLITINSQGLKNFKRSEKKLNNYAFMYEK